MLRRLLIAATLVAAGCTAPEVPGEAAPGGGAGGGEAARVTSVTDGDTLRLTGLGKTRLIGVDTPEVYGQAECFGREASAFAKRTLSPGTPVRYRLGTEPRDRYGRALAYLWLEDGTFFNRLLVERGYAQPLTIPPNVDHADEFVAAGRRARLAGRGLWGRGDCATRGGGERDCSDFATPEEAQRWFDRRGGGPGRNVDQLDGEDGDGRVCEG